MTKNTYRLYIVLAVVFLMASNCTTPSNIQNQYNVNNSPSVNKPSPSPSPSAISSIVSQKDGINDVADGDGCKPLTKLNGMDLSGVQLEITDSDLKVTFEANEPITRLQEWALCLQNPVNAMCRSRGID